MVQTEVVGVTDGCHAAEDGACAEGCGLDVRHVWDAAEMRLVYAVAVEDASCKEGGREDGGRM